MSSDCHRDEDPRRGKQKDTIHGCFRNREADFLTIDVPGAVATQASGITPQSEITGRVPNDRRKVSRLHPVERPIPDDRRSRRCGAVPRSPSSLCPFRKRDAPSSSKGMAATAALRHRRDRNDASQGRTGAIRVQSCQPSPSLRFKVPMSGSNALRPLTLF